jgi:hypothetical protein
MSVEMHFSVLNDILDRLFYLATRALGVALHLLNHAFSLEFWIVCSHACLALGASGRFVQYALCSIFSHRPPSVD